MGGRRYRYVVFTFLAVVAAVAIVLWTRSRQHAGGVSAGDDEKPVVYVQQGHGSQVWCIGWSPDGRRAISGDAKGTVKIWDVGSGKEERTLVTHAGQRVSFAAFLPDGRRFLTTGKDSTVRIWDLETMTQIRRMGASSGIRTAGISPDGLRVMAVTNDSIARIWDINTGREVRQLVTGPSGSPMAEFSSDGRFALSQVRDSVLALWDLSTGREVKEYHNGGNGLFRAVFDPGGTRIIIGCANFEAIRQVISYNKVAAVYRLARISSYAGAGHLEVWDRDSGAKIRDILAHNGSVMSIQLLPDGNRIITCGLDSTVKLWSTDDLHLLKELPRHPSSVICASVSPDGRLVLTGDRDGTVRLWDIERSELVREFATQPMTLGNVAFTQDGKQMRVDNDDGLMSWDLSAGNRVDFLYPGARGEFWGSSRDLKYGFLDSSAGEPGEFYLKFWSLDRRGIASVTSHPVKGYLQEWRFSGDGRFCLIGTFDRPYDNLDTSIVKGHYTRWDVTTGQSSGAFQIPCWIGSMRPFELSNDGRWAVTAQWDPDLVVYDFATQKKMILPDSAEASAYTNDPNGAAPHADDVLPVYGNNAIEFWSMDPLRRLKSFDSAPGTENIVISPDGHLFAGSLGSSIELWDAQTGRKIQELVGHAGPILRVSFSADEKRLASTGWDGTTRLWNLETGKEIMQFVSFQNGEWVAVTPEGYYTASVNGDAFLNVRKGSEVTGIEPYRSTFYQPNVVEAALRLGDSEAAISEMLGCKASCTTIADVPDMEPPYLTVKYPESGDTLTSADTTLAFHVEDRHFAINTVKVYVNGRPVTGDPLRRAEDKSPGIQLDIPKEKKTLDLKVPLRLDEGDNLITIAARGKSEALDSLHVFLLTENLVRRMDIDTVWILAVGVNMYQDRKLQSLKYCQSDAQGLVQAFQAQQGKTCSKVMALCISDAGPIRPTYENIVDNIGYLRQAKEADLAVLFLAGHGVNDNYGDFYFLPSDAEVTGTHEFKKSKAISGAMLQTAVDVPARRFVFIDACHSEGIGVDLVKLSREFKENRVLIMTSSEGNRPSEEADSVKHGLFTYALMQGLNGGADITGSDGKISAMELITYVTDRVATLTQHRQNPVFWAPGGLSNFVVALAPSTRLAVR